MPRLFYTAPDGAAGTQISVQSGQGATRQEAVHLNASDIVGGPLPPGDFEGQLLFWNGAEWVPVPAGGTQGRIDGLTSVTPSQAQLLFGDGGGGGYAALIGETAQLNDNLANVVIRATNGEWQAGFNDGDTATQILGDETSIHVSATSPGGLIELSSFGVTQTMFESWLVALGEGSPFVGLSLVSGFLSEVAGSQYQQAAGAHVFRNPNLLGVPLANLTLGHAGDAMTAGFLGAAPVVRQVVTNTEELVALNSLIAGLAALGLVSPAVVSAPAAKRVVGYTAAAPVVIELLPAGHTPGFYSVSLFTLVRAVGTAGNLSRSYQFSTPTAGAVQIAGFAAASLTVLGPVPGGTTTLSGYSTGVTALTCTMTPAGVTGAPVIDLTASANFLGT